MTWKCKIGWHDRVKTGPGFRDPLLCKREGCMAIWVHTYDGFAPGTRKVTSEQFEQEELILNNCVINPKY